ncbi:hypothetical protein [Pseudomonas sp. fls2-241-TYG-175]|uniref:hypothetical protein n=1 Tax=Pseudomonas sp. fls2-241-TYG-175 TaxID=3040312 RepID=UPI002555D8DB|nr:hypothetical protein [Pseudomonas sp. fls2-241-TYG-175]
MIVQQRSCKNAPSVTPQNLPLCHRGLCRYRLCEHRQRFEIPGSGDIQSLRRCLRDLQGGVSVRSGVTPDEVTLRAGAGYFDGEKYTVTYRKDGYTSSTQTLESGIDGWYWGNIVIGGLIGMLIVDPATGAMYTLPEKINSTLTVAPVSAISAVGQSSVQVQ